MISVGWACSLAVVGTASGLAWLLMHLACHPVAIFRAVNCAMADSSKAITVRRADWLAVLLVNFSNKTIAVRRTRFCAVALASEPIAASWAAYVTVRLWNQCLDSDSNWLLCNHHGLRLSVVGITWLGLFAITAAVASHSGVIKVVCLLVARPHFSENLEAVPENDDPIVDNNSANGENQVPSDPHASVHVVD